MSNKTVSWSEILSLLSPGGQQQLIDFIRTAQQTRGANWLPEIQAEFPMFSLIVQLVCSKTADEAFNELQTEFPNYPLYFVKSGIENLHARLRAEIEKKR